MKKLTGCQYAAEINSSKQDKHLRQHIAGCPECQEAQKVSDWMRKFAAQTAAPQNLPAPGFLLFKGRLLQKQSAATRAAEPIFWMQIVALFLLILTSIWFALKVEMPIASILKEIFFSLLSVAPLLIFGVISAILICLGFAHFLRETKKLKK